MAESLFGTDGMFSSIISLGGITVPARAKFVATTVAMTTYSSLTFGLLGGVVGAMLTPVGPLIPFLSGCWVGYSVGVYQVWHTSKFQALMVAERYPRLLVHSLEREFGVFVPKHVVLDNNAPETTVDEDVARFRTPNPHHPLIQWICQGGLGRISWAILASQSCKPDVAELERLEREQIIETHYKAGDE